MFPGPIAIARPKVPAAQPRRGNKKGPVPLHRACQLSRLILSIKSCQIKSDQVVLFPYGQNSRRARCRTHEPHFKHRFMINQAR
jgi:hypothetical protein